MTDADVSMAEVLTREEKDRIGFANAIELSSDEDDDPLDEFEFDFGGFY